jgi:glycosyltransferase involved in cell wall biosynthesis
MAFEDLAIVVPSFNENQVLSETLVQLQQFPLVILVDDASNDATIETVKHFSNVVYLRHVVNRGQGASLETGFEFIRRQPIIKYVATFDADGQHDVEDLKSMYKKISLAKYSVLLGSRFCSESRKSRNFKGFLLRVYARILKSNMRMEITDVHNGLRIFDLDFVKHFNVTTDGYGHADEILRSIKIGQHRYAEHFTNISYTDYSKGKGQPLINGVNIIFDKIWRNY